MAEPADLPIVLQGRLPLPARPKQPRGLRIYMLGVLMFFIAIALGGIWLLQLNLWRPSLDSWFSAMSGVLAFTILFAYPFSVIFAHYRTIITRRCLDPHAAFICPRCLYVLTNLPDAGACPECGTGYTRAEIVALWENRYGLWNRYPRSRAYQPSGPPAVLTPPPVQTLPWSGPCSLRRALEEIERAARRNGFASQRFAAYSLQLERALPGTDRPLPEDLAMVLTWFDPALWSWFINPRQLRRPAPSAPPPQAVPAPTMEESFAARFVEDEPADIIRFRPPPMFRVVALAPADNQVSADQPASPAPLGVYAARALPFEFADALSGAAIIYAMGESAFPAGAILAADPAAGRSIWLADSLAQWLTRLVACQGAEPALVPPDQRAAELARIPEPLRDLYLAEFNARNPASA